MIKTIVPAFIFAAALILSASALSPRDNMLSAEGCDLSYGVENCPENAVN